MCFVHSLAFLNPRVCHSHTMDIRYDAAALV